MPTTTLSAEPGAPRFPRWALARSIISAAADTLAGGVTILVIAWLALGVFHAQHAVTHPGTGRTLFAAGVIGLVGVTAKAIYDRARDAVHEHRGTLYLWMERRDDAYGQWVVRPLEDYQLTVWDAAELMHLHTTRDAAITLATQWMRDWSDPQLIPNRSEGWFAQVMDTGRVVVQDHAGQRQYFAMRTLLDFATGAAFFAPNHRTGQLMLLCAEHNDPLVAAVDDTHSLADLNEIAMDHQHVTLPSGVDTTAFLDGFIATNLDGDLVLVCREHNQVVTCIEPRREWAPIADVIQRHHTCAPVHEETEEGDDPEWAEYDPANLAGPPRRPADDDVNPFVNEESG